LATARWKNARVSRSLRSISGRTRRSRPLRNQQATSCPHRSLTGSSVRGSLSVSKACDSRRLMIWPPTPTRATPRGRRLPSGCELRDHAV